MKQMTQDYNKQEQVKSLGLDILAFYTDSGQTQCGQLSGLQSTLSKYRHSLKSDTSVFGCCCSFSFPPSF